MSQERDEIVTLINDARVAGARQSEACHSVGISAKTYQRWTRPGNSNDGRLDATREPHNKLSEWERQRLLKVANAPEYADLPPCKIVSRLADEGRYLASEATFYRVLKAEKQLSHRQKSNPKTTSKPRALVAAAPNEIYSWDITYLPTAVKGIFFYLYLVMDIYSRKIVGWQVFAEESSALAADLMVDICLRENIKRRQVTLHSDNGSPMKGATMLATLQQLGVMPTYSTFSAADVFSEHYCTGIYYIIVYPDKCPDRKHVQS
ncbi:MAG: DDE-type integrase/transposase/recombinase [Pseudomonadales bacterium]